MLSSEANVLSRLSQIGSDFTAATTATKTTKPGKKMPPFVGTADKPSSPNDCSEQTVDMSLKTGSSHMLGQLASEPTDAPLSGINISPDPFKPLEVTQSGMPTINTDADDIIDEYTTDQSASPQQQLGIDSKLPPPVIIENKVAGGSAKRRKIMAKKGIVGTSTPIATEVDDLTVTNEPRKENTKLGQPIVRPPLYSKIRVNRAVPPLTERPKNSAGSDETKCKCSPNYPNQCGPGKGCINYESAVECEANCPAGENCQNHVFTKGFKSKVQIEFFESKGYGVVIQEKIPCDTFIIEYVGELIDSNEFNKRFEQLAKKEAKNLYFLSIGDGIYIDSRLMGNKARFVNHSCEPNCFIKKWNVK